MADDTTTATPDPSTIDPALLNRLIAQTLNQQPVPAAQPQASTNEGRGWASLLGEALGGGQQYGTTAERESGGLAALMAAGARMSQASDYSQQRHTLGSILAAGTQGASEALGQRQAVTAAQQSALLDYQQKQQEMQLARVKEAIPLLTLQQQLAQQKRLAGLPSSIGGTNTSIGAVGDGDPIAGLPKDQALAAIIKRESGGQNIPTAILGPDGKPASTASGYYQMLDSTWQEAAGLAGIKNPPARAMMASREDQDRAASALFDKYGYKPWAASAPGSAKPPGAPPATATAQTPPAASTAPPAPVVGKGTPLPAGRPTGPPVITDQPPAGSATVAGPGAPTVGAPLPPSPAVAGDVNAIIGGMTGAGASPTTLAPGSAVPVPQTTTQASTQPQAPPAVEVTPPAATPTDQGPPTFTYTRHDPPPGMLQGSKLTPEESSVVADARNAYQNAIRVAITPEQRQQAEATLQATLDKELTARAGRTDAAAKQMADWYANDFKQQQEQHKLAVDSFYKNRDQQQQFQNQTQLEITKGEQQRLANKEQVFNQANQKGLETAQTEQAAARDTVAQLEGFRAISDNVGQPGWLQTTKFPGTDQSIAERLQQAGIKLDDTGGVQLLRGGITNMVRTLRTGMAMGSLSDRDLEFIQRMGPTEWMDPDTRAAAVGYLQQAYRAKMRFASDVQKEMARGKNYGDAVDAADAKQKPFVPTVSADLTAHWGDMTGDWPQQRARWAEQNDVRPGTLIHMGDGRIVVIKKPKANQ